MIATQFKKDDFYLPITRPLDGPSRLMRSRVAVNHDGVRSHLLLYRRVNVPRLAEI